MYPIDRDPSIGPQAHEPRDQGLSVVVPEWPGLVRVLFHLLAIAVVAFHVLVAFAYLIAMGMTQPPGRQLVFALLTILDAGLWLALLVAILALWYRRRWLILVLPFASAFGAYLMLALFSAAGAYLAIGY